MTSPVGYRQYVLALSPTRYWPVNETSGTTAFEQSGNGGADLTISGSPRMAQYRGVGRPAQHAMTFDGSDDYCEGAGPTVQGYRTWMAWFYQEGPNSGASNMWIVTQGGAGTYTSALFLGTTNLLSGVIWTSAGATVMSTASALPVVPYRWNMAAMVFDGPAPSLTLYLNGDRVARSTSSSGSVGTSTTVAIGRRPDNSQNKFRGHINHVACWMSSSATSALNAQQIADLYKRGLPLMVPQSTRRLVRA